MGRRVGAVSLRMGPQEGEIGLGLGPVAQANRVLVTDMGQVPNPLEEQAREIIDLVGVVRADGAHLDDFPIDQLDALILTEDAGLGHPIVLVNGEQSLRRLERHQTIPSE
jgi:hypothetical protein